MRSDGSEGSDRPADPIERIRSVSRLMDEAFRIPGTRFRVGLDGLLGLIPGVGDVTGAAMGGWIVVSAARLGAPPSLLLRMLVNVGLDALVGGVPVVGDLFDFAFKAHRRNFRLLEAHLADPERTRRASRRAVALAVAGVLALTVLLALAVAWMVLSVARMALSLGG